MVEKENIWMGRKILWVPWRGWVGRGKSRTAGAWRVSLAVGLQLSSEVRITCCLWTVSENSLQVFFFVPSAEYG